MTPGERVLLLQEEGAGEFETHAYKLRAVHQDGTECGDGLVELLVAGLPVRDGMGGVERLHAGAEAQAGCVLGAVVEIRHVPRGVGAEGGRRAPSDCRKKQDQQAQNADTGEKPRHDPNALPLATERRARKRAVRICRIFAVSGF